MSNVLRDHEYLEHIEAAILKIQRFMKDKDEAQFVADDLLQDAVIRMINPY